MPDPMKSVYTGRSIAFDLMGDFTHWTDSGFVNFAKKFILFVANNKNSPYNATKNNRFVSLKK